MKVNLVIRHMSSYICWTNTWARHVLAWILAHFPRGLHHHWVFKQIHHHRQQPQHSPISHDFLPPPHLVMFYVFVFPPTLSEPPLVASGPVWAPATQFFGHLNAGACADLAIFGSPGKLWCTLVLEVKCKEHFQELSAIWPQCTIITMCRSSHF